MAEVRAAPPSVLVVMGVSGAGKTVIGERLAAALGWSFRDADTFHSPANISKMASGVPLGDADRGPWLSAIADWIDALRAEGGRAVIACSALKRAYRSVIVGDRPDVRLIYLQGSRVLIASRVAARSDHFMPASLLDSQFAALEEPAEDEAPLVMPVALSPAEIVARVIRVVAL